MSSTLTEKGYFLKQIPIFSLTALIDCFSSSHCGFIQPIRWDTVAKDTNKAALKESSCWIVEKKSSEKNDQ